MESKALALDNFGHFSFGHPTYRLASNTQKVCVIDIACHFKQNRYDYASITIIIQYSTAD
jgi:hypothetical protein